MKMKYLMMILLILTILLITNCYFFFKINTQYDVISKTQTHIKECLYTIYPITETTTLYEPNFDITKIKHIKRKFNK
jgi:hypothetical protein